MKLKYRVIEHFRGKYPIGSMYRLFEVSRSGCYAWRKRQGKPEKDQWLVDLIIDCQQRSKQTCGCRRVRRWMERQHGRKVSVKAILRIMRKLDLLSQAHATANRIGTISRPFTNIRICCSVRLPNHSPIVFGQPISPIFPQLREWCICVPYWICAEKWCWLTGSAAI